MNLLYQISVGRNYDSILACCVESLRTAGRYKDELIVFTDHEVDIPGADVKPVIEPQDWTFEALSMLRVQMALNYDFAKYENVMYLDTDHLAFNDINPFFETQDKLWSMKEFVKSLGRSDFHGGYLTEQEKSRNDGTCFCSGILCGPSMLFAKAIRLWDQTFKEPYEGWEKYREQSALNVLAYRKLIELNPYSENWISGARRDSYSGFTHLKMVHFWDRTKNSMPKIWKKYARQSNSNRSG